MAMPRSAVTTNARESSVAVRSMSERTSSGEVLCFCSASTGTNAWEDAPSANSRRSSVGRGGEAEGDHKRGGGEAGAEPPGDDEVAREPQDAADEGQSAHSYQGAQEVHARISPLSKA